MTTFNLRRFWHTLKWNLFAERRNLLTTPLMVCGALLFAFIVVAILGNPVDYTRHTLFRIAGIMIIVSVFVSLMYCGSVFDSLYKKKQTALNHLMLPASNMEKFLARHLVVIVGYTIAFLIGLVAADFLQWAASGLFGVEHPQLMLSTFKNTTIGIKDGSVWLNVWFSAWIVSLFILGGTFFRKKPALSTLIVFIFLMLLLGTVANHMGKQQITEHIATIKTLSGIILPVITIANFALAYLLFCRLQLTGRKWINL